jgi:DNA-binding response OmpR family regulator
MPRRVLVIEDTRDIAELLSLHLKDLGCEVTLADDGLLGFEEARSGGYDLIILDLMLPGMDGIELCRRLRGEAAYTPVLMLTAKSSELDRVLGLEIGADDYLTKPFSIRELLARVKAIFRRVEQLNAERGSGDTVKAGDMTIDTRKRRVTVAGRAVDLTSKEFDLLFHLARQPGQVFARRQLLDAVWGHGSEHYEHTVNTHINRLRAKIEDDPSKPRFLLTVWGVGYKFNDQLGD